MTPAIRECKAMHEENVLSILLREDVTEKKERTVEVKRRLLQEDVMVFFVEAFEIFTS